MKVTAIIPDEIIDEVKALTGKKTITESITLALSEWLKTQKIKKLNEHIQKKPLAFTEGYSGTAIRNLNRKDR